MFEVSQAVVVGELPVLDIQAPAAIETTLGGDHSLDAFLRIVSSAVIVCEFG